MCGIAGILGRRDEGDIEGMVAAIAHRGPDATGTHVEEGVALGAQRLAIVDIARGTQPMKVDGCVLVANAEMNRRFNFFRLIVASYRILH